MIDRTTAVAAAENHLREVQASIGQDLALDHSATRRGPAGWLFCWNTESFLATGRVADALAGNGPLLVHGDSGKVERLPVDASLEGFQRELP